MTRETSDLETPANLATSWIVGCPLLIDRSLTARIHGRFRLYEARVTLPPLLHPDVVSPAWPDPSEVNLSRFQASIFLCHYGGLAL